MLENNNIGNFKILILYPQSQKLFLNIGYKKVILNLIL
jgi:hypothetical protein